MEHHRSRRVSSAFRRKLRDHLPVRGFHRGFIPIEALHLVDLSDVKFAVVKRDSVRPVQAFRHHHSVGVARVFGIGKSQNLVVGHVRRQQHSARTKGQHPRLRAMRKHADVKALRQLQLPKLELLGARAGRSQQQKQEGTEWA